MADCATSPSTSTAATATRARWRTSCARTGDRRGWPCWTWVATPASRRGSCPPTGWLSSTPRWPAAPAAATCAPGAAACTAFPSGYLHHWLPLMLLKHYLLGLDPDAGMHAALDRWYNARDPAADRWLPAYRHGVLASKHGNTAVLATVAERFA